MNPTNEQTISRAYCLEGGCNFLDAFNATHMSASQHAIESGHQVIFQSNETYVYNGQWVCPKCKGTTHQDGWDITNECYHCKGKGFVSPETKATS